MTSVSTTMHLSLIDDDAVSILGEILWHAATTDASIQAVSEAHTRDVLTHAARFLEMGRRAEPIRFLEVAAYAHTTGYMLASQHGWESTITDVSVETLALGARHARDAGMAINAVRRVAVDFHQLPFADASFDVVYISSALHHTLRWEIVLGELLRVTAGKGILILQNEPCHREFCFYKFSTNRPDAYRPVEALLAQQGILKTVAEPFPGSRPEALFGMIENQTMPISGILAALEAVGSVVSLEIDSDVVMSDFDRSILAAPRKLPGLAQLIERGLMDRVREANHLLDATDEALGMQLPTYLEVAEMAAATARRIAALPAPIGQPYRIALAGLFGAALTIVARKSPLEPDIRGSRELLYDHGSRKGVTLGYPPRLTAVLHLAQDLLPDIQVVGTEELRTHFGDAQWALHDGPDLRYLILRGTAGNIELRELPADGEFVVLLRAYASPLDAPFRLQLLADDHEIAGVDVHQPESFLLRGRLPSKNAARTLTLRSVALDGAPLAAAKPVTVPAVRVVCIASAEGLQA